MRSVSWLTGALVAVLLVSCDGGRGSGQGAVDDGSGDVVDKAEVEDVAQRLLDLWRLRGVVVAGDAIRVEVSFPEPGFWQLEGLEEKLHVLEDATGLHWTVANGILYVSSKHRPVTDDLDVLVGELYGEGSSRDGIGALLRTSRICVSRASARLLVAAPGLIPGIAMVDGGVDEAAVVGHLCSSSMTTLEALYALSWACGGRLEGTGDVTRIILRGAD